MIAWLKNYARNDRKAFMGLCAVLVLTMAFIGYTKINQYYNPQVKGPWIVRHLAQDWVDSGGIEATHAMWISDMKRQLQRLEKWRYGNGLMSPKSRSSKERMDQRIAHLRQQIGQAEKDQQAPKRLRRMALNKY